MEHEELSKSKRPDGSVRPAVRVREGYTPPEEQAKYDKFKGDGKGPGVPGGDPGSYVPKPPKSKTALKNEKRNAKKKDEPATGGHTRAEKPTQPVAPASNGTAEAPTEAAAEAGKGETSEVEKKVKALRKRIRQIDDLAKKQAEGATLNADQLAKIASRSELELEITKWETLGDVDVGKKVKGLKKKLKQIDDLEKRGAGGETLNEDQKGKIAAREAVEAELEAMAGMMIK